MASHVYRLSSTLLLDSIEQYLPIWALIKTSASLQYSSLREEYWKIEQIFPLGKIKIIVL